jgi:FkbM family methyltransferase
LSKLVSFSHNMEDVILWRALKDVRHGFYVDVGAAWPDENSTTKVFYDAGWNGLNIEPNPKCFQSLSHERSRDINLNCAVGETSGLKDVSIFNYADGPSKADAQNTSFGAPKQSGIQHSTKTESLKTIWEQNVPEGRDVHFLKIDVNGNEEDVILGHDWSNFRPWIVLVASHEAGDAHDVVDATQEHLKKHAYKPVYFDGINRFYLAEERRDMEYVFRTPPNVRDNFMFSRENNTSLELKKVSAELKKLSFAKREAVILREMLDKANQNILATAPTRERNNFSIFRKFNPERIIRKAIRKRFPKQHTVKHSAVSASSVEIRLDDVIVNFSTDALKDERGVGRVAKEQLRELMKRQNTNIAADSAVNDLPVIHFFPSIHWCPSVLPPHSVVMIHDVIPLILSDVFPEHIVDEWIWKFAAIARNAESIVTVSESSAADISSTLSIPRDKIFVVHNGVDIAHWQSDVPSQIDTPAEPYFVCIGSRDYHKNLDVLFNAICLPEAQHCKLLVVGSGFKKNDTGLQPEIKERVQFLGRLSDHDLAHVLENAAALLFPSRYEGFGLPPLEAGLLGVPTISSSRPAMTEVLTQGVTFCDPDNPLEWALAMRNILAIGKNIHERELLKAHIAENFNWEKSIDQLIKAMHNVHN